jgi:hypothetical protein
MKAWVKIMPPFLLLIKIQEKRVAIRLPSLSGLPGSVTSKSPFGERSEWSHSCIGV